MRLAAALLILWAQALVSAHDHDDDHDHVDCAVCTVADNVHALDPIDQPLAVRAIFYPSAHQYPPVDPRLGIVREDYAAPRGPPHS